MPEFVYLIIVCMLLCLAVMGLIVGVSNDAVNFLNSSIGSRVAPRHIIMIVASIGVFIGAASSDGMMDLARNKMLSPEQFMFGEIMIIFLAVMMTDIILLDIFNTFGLPTSTTVSLVFELLGAATAISLVSMTGKDEGIGHLGQYIHSDKAIEVVSGIFISVILALILGTVVQWLSRVLFTFNYKKRWKWAGPVWSGLALTFLSYFLIIKGMKHASFITEGMHTWIDEHITLLLIAFFVGSTLLMQLLLSVFKVNILRIVVLYGTFALAMAFAGNDLVNFIGVPLTGLESFLAWSQSGLSPMEFNMGETLNAPNAGKTWMLILAGAIMVTTLWLSKKARTVTETEVNLGRQDEGIERFSANPIARGMVRMVFTLLGGGKTPKPGSLQARIDKNFEPYQEPLAIGEEPAAFDLVRASVNLTVASVLIALGSSLQLPLSTTYVGFMVAMGTSLADRAWGRDSAVFRISGVLSVIGGWFLTGIIAFTAAAIFALVIHGLGVWGILLLVALGIFSWIRGTRHHKKQEAEKEAAKKEVLALEAQGKEGALTTEQLQADTQNRVLHTLKLVRSTYSDALEGLVTEDRNSLKKVHQDITQLAEETEKFKFNLFTRIKYAPAGGSKLFLNLYDFEEDLVQSTNELSRITLEYVSNLHSPLEKSQVEALRKVQTATAAYMDAVHKAVETTSAPEDLQAQKRKLIALIDEALATQATGIKDETYGARNSMLVFSILLETKDLIAVSHRFVKLFASL